VFGEQAQRVFQNLLAALRAFALGLARGTGGGGIDQRNVLLQLDSRANLSVITYHR